jgi:hypothetical protein
MSLAGIALGFIVVPLASVIMYFLTRQLWQLMFRGASGEALTYESRLYVPVLTILCACAAYSFYQIAFRWTGAAALTAGALTWWALAASASAFMAPGASYAFMWPLAAGLMTVVASLWIKTKGRETRVGYAALLFTGAVVLLIVIPSIKMICLAFPTNEYMIAVLVVLCVGLLLPQLQQITNNRTWIAPVGVAVMTVTLAGILVTKTSITASEPKASQVIYLGNADTQSAVWASSDRRLEPWYRSFFADPVNRALKEGESPKWFGPRWLQGRSVLVGQAPTLSVASPVVSVSEDSVANSSRKLHFRISSARGAPELWVNVSAAAPIVSAYLKDSVVYSSTNSKKEPLRELTIRYFGAPPDGIDLGLEMNGNGPLKIGVADCSYNLPNMTPPVPPRPANMIPARTAGDLTVLTRQYSF